MLAIALQTMAQHMMAVRSIRRLVQPSRVFWMLAFSVACIMGAGCKRVPTEQVFVPQAMSAIKAGEKRSRKQKHQEKSQALGELCIRACDNWLDHQFIVPVSYDDQPESVQESIDELIELQRQSNQDACVAECKKARDFARTQCVAGAPSILDIEDCKR